MSRQVRESMKKSGQVRQRPEKSKKFPTVRKISKKYGKFRGSPKSLKKLKLIPEKSGKVRQSTENFYFRIFHTFSVFFLTFPNFLYSYVLCRTFLDFFKWL